MNKSLVPASIAVIQELIKDTAVHFPKEARIAVHFSREDGVSVWVYPFGNVSAECIHGTADDSCDVAAKLRSLVDQWEVRRDNHRTAKRRESALKLIDLRDAFGTVTAAQLRSTAGNLIDDPDFIKEVENTANELAAGGPFVVLLDYTATANGAPEDDEEIPF